MIRSPRPLTLLGLAAGTLLIALLLFSSSSRINLRSEETSHLRTKIFGGSDKTPNDKPAPPSTPKDDTLKDEDWNSHGELISDEAAAKIPYMAPISNKTLGFQKILILNLPERTDKRDALSLTAALTDLKFDFIDGVKGPDIPDRAVPGTMNRTLVWETNLGSWRAHINAARAIVENKWASALILEDDMDWDVNIHMQMRNLAEGARYISKDYTNKRDHNSPYGEGWDVLWVGHCGEKINKEGPKSRNYTVHPDPLVPPYDKVKGMHKFKEYPEYTRWIHETGAPICTFGYALSYEGAQKVLYRMGMVGIDHGAFDNSMAWFCNDEEHDMRCITVTPPYFYTHRAKGLIKADSDIQGGPKDPVMREKSYTDNIVYSTRMNILRLIKGEKPVNQYKQQEEDEKKDKIEKEKKEKENKEKEAKEKKEKEAKEKEAKEKEGKKDDEKKD